MNVVLLVVAIAGLCVHLTAIVAIFWRGGAMVGRVDAAIKVLTDEIHSLRVTRDEHIGVLARVVGQLDSLEERTSRLERRRE